MALRLAKSQLLNLSSRQLLRISSKCASKSVVVDEPKEDRIEHKQVVYQDGSVKVVEKKTHTKQVSGRPFGVRSAA